jgi:hypothetical protein
MLPAVRNGFLSFSLPLEGMCNYLYLDDLGLITTGLGDLCDPMSLALALPWQVGDSTVPATRMQIIAEWNRVKGLQQYKNAGGGSPIFKNSAELHLSEGGIALLVDQRLEMNDKYLSKSFPTFVNWPADAQLGLHSMSWACGPGLRPEFPHFSASVDKYDFASAAGPAGDPNANFAARGQSWMKDSVPHAVDAQHPHGEAITNAGLRKRNLENRILFQNAVVVMRDKMDEDTLYWPKALT